MKLFLKKALIWIKAYWWIPAVLILGFIAFIFGSKDDARALFDLVHLQRKTAKKEVKIIEEIHRKKDEDLLKNQEKYLEEKRKLEASNRLDQSNFEASKTKKENDLTQEIKENPSKTLSKIAEEMGWDYKK